jgi:signal transduction histidine kinase
VGADGLVSGRSAADGSDDGLVGGRSAADAPSRLAALGEIAAEVAHELRNLLAVITSSAFVARIEVDRGDAAAARMHVVKVEHSARTAQALVDDLMALAREEPVPKERTRVADVLGAARADLGGAAAWDDALCPPEVEVRAHPRLLGRLLHALFENAVLASAPRHPRIATRVAVTGDRVVFEVSDDGPGVPEAIAARIFEPLVTGRAGGSGLGLALARRIALAHGGTLVLVPPEEASEHVGATFRLHLPP